MPGKQTDAAKAAGKTATQSVRARMAEDLSDQYDVLMAVIKDALNAERTVKVEPPCPKCGCTHYRYAKVRDTTAALKAAEFLANQGLGRPGEDQTRIEKSFIVNRHVVEPKESP